MTTTTPINTSVRLSAAILKRLDDLAAADNVSRNALLVEALSKAALPKSSSSIGEGRRMLVLRLPAQVRRKLQQLADRQGVSLARAVESVVAQYLASRNPMLGDNENEDV